MGDDMIRLQRYLIIVNLLLPVSAFPQVFADLVVRNGNVITVDEQQPIEESFAVRDGKFIAVGDDEIVEKTIGPDTQVIDASGKTVTPGFIDAHMHPNPIYPFESPHATIDVSPEQVTSMQDLIALLRKKAEFTPEGQWIKGSRYQDTVLGRHPTRKDLDEISTKHPIRLSHSSGHVRTFNSYALQKAGITRETEDPPGGSFDRDTDGEPNGVCRESASSLVTRGNIDTPVPSEEELLEAYRVCFERFLAKGITSIGDAGISPHKWDIYQKLVESGMPVRIYAMFRESYLPDLKRLKLRTGFGNDHLKIGAIKLFHGNSLSGRTCWLYEPYADRPDYYGIPPARSQQKLDELIFDIHAAGFQAAVHSNGDREIDMVLDAYEKALLKIPNDNHRHRIEHASVVNESILERVKELKIVLALHSYIYEHGDKMEEYGERRWGMMHANRSSLEKGIVVAGNSDYGVSAADPMKRIQSLVTRTHAGGKTYGAEQKISPMQAIWIFTQGSAYAQFEENIKGSIQVGKRADFVILSADPNQVDPFSIKEIRVEKTFIEGELVYELKQ